MSNGNLNPLNDLSRVYLDHVAKINQNNEEIDKKRWEGELNLQMKTDAVKEEKKAKRWQDDDGDGKWYEKSDKNVVFYSHPNSQELIGYVHFFPPATEIWFRNPHVRYYVELINQQGKKESWDVRTSSPSLLVRKGWTKETIKVGDEISIFGHPGRDGRKLLSVISIKLPNGSSLGQKYPD